MDPRRRRSRKRDACFGPGWIVLCGLTSTANGLVVPDTKQRRNNYSAIRFIPAETTRLFVLTTPEAIIEQASTTKLLDDLIDESVRTSARRPIMMQFDPSSGWIWKRWKGTVFSETWDACVYRCLYASAVFVMCRSFPQVKDTLSGLPILWGQLLSVTTFTLTFFVNQSYALWRKCSELSRSLQGRLHDMDMTLAAHATRSPPTTPTGPTTYTAASRQVLELVSRYVRLFNLLTYASFTRSHRPVLTPRGMRRLVERGLMTPLERKVLVNADVPATQRHNAVLLWIIRAFIEGHEAGHFKGDAGFEQQFIEKAHVCRSAYGAIGDELQGRMPLAYAHIVQVLVDLVLVMYPFMAYSAGMSGFMCVLGTGLLTIGYQGLFDLAKQFLDPYDNENYGKGEDPLVVDTLIAETNAGSVRWMNGLAEMPLSPQKVRDGDLSEHLLPLRGYSIDELKQKEEEKLVQQERRDKEELERVQKNEQDLRMRSAAEAMIPALFNRNSNNLNTIADSDDAVYLASDRAGGGVEFPWAYGTTFRLANTVNGVIFSQNSNATSLHKALIPKGTAPHTSYVKKGVDVVELVVAEQRIHVNIEKDPRGTLLGVGELAGGGEDSFKKWAMDNAYVRNFDEFGVDREEIRRSQLLAYEIWAEEFETAKLKTAVRIRTTYEENMSRISEMRLPVGYDLLENYRNLQAKANEPDKWSAQESPDFRKSDNTQRDRAPSELLELTNNNEVVPLAPSADRCCIEINTSCTEDDLIVPVTNALVSALPFDPYISIADDVEGPPQSELVTIDIAADDDQSFSYTDYEKQVKEILEAEKEELLETQAILNAPPGADGIEAPHQDTKSSLNAMNKTDAKIVLVTESTLESAPSLSPIADDEDLPNLKLATETIVNVAVADLEIVGADIAKQVPEIFETEEEELRETQAILNAPPGADNIEALEKFKDSLLKATNSTDNDLAVLEMDAPKSSAEFDAITSLLPEVETQAMDLVPETIGVAPDVLANKTTPVDDGNADTAPSSFSELNGDRPMDEAVSSNDVDP